MAEPTIPENSTTTPDNVPITPENVPDKVPDKVSDKVPDKVPNKVPDKVPDKVPTNPDAPPAEEGPAPEQERPKTRGRPFGSKDAKPRIRRVPVVSVPVVI